MALFPLDRLLRGMITHGRLTVIGTDGKSETFGSPGARPAVTVRLKDPRLPLRMVKGPSVAVGEAYVDGSFVIEEGTLREFLEIAIVSQTKAAERKPGTIDEVSRWFSQIYHTKDVLNRIGKAEQNVRHHYDISHKLYEMFLDEDMQYSCAYWREGVTSLEEAQADKRRHIARKLLLKPGMEVLDIGSGWGGLGLHLAREHGVRVTGVTLSQDQYETSLKRAEAEGLSHLVTFRKVDYRLVTGTFDRIVSVGMFEHVGKPHYGEYFEHVRRLLKPDGVALIHTIGRANPPRPIGAWIRRYIFPGAYTPSLSELTPITEKKNLWITDLEVWRLHYAKTLAAWNDRFQARRAEVAAMFDERFVRMWEFYLLACEADFLYHLTAVFQIQLAKSIDAVPITRDYMYPAPDLQPEPRPEAAAAPAPRRARARKTEQVDAAE